MDSQADEIREPPIAYATFGRRLRALVIDGVILTVGLVAIILVADLGHDTPGTGRFLVAVIFVEVFLYEPVMVWRYGATIGHRVTNLRVVDDASGGNPSFRRAYARYVVKSVVGLPSFVTMAVNRRHQAMHDVVTHTTVQIRDMGSARPDDYAWERTPAATPGLPSRLRRGIVILAYLAVVFVMMVIASWVLASRACLNANQCTGGEDLLVRLIGLSGVGAAAFCIVAGWRGELIGCRVRR